MEFITSALIGGLIYDATKIGLSSTLDIVKVGLKDIILTEEEKQTIVKALDDNNINENSTKEDIETIIESIANIENLLQSISQNNQTKQNINIENFKGANIGTNNAEINMTFND